MKNNPYCVNNQTLKKSLLSIDWEEQWRLHGADFHEGCVHVDLKLFDPIQTTTIRLQPGPGFGDLSHTTTRLMLKLMASLVKGKHVLDVGCGSGILSFAAHVMGASGVQGIDIDLEAIVHSQLNSRLNQMDDSISFWHPSDYKPPSGVHSLLILMNMIRSEQQVALASLQSIQPFIKGCITSGILLEERIVYLEQCKSYGWELQQECTEGDWMSFYFQKKELNR